MSYIELIRIFLKNKIRILSVSAIVGAIVAFFAFFVMDPIFLSTATIKTTSSSSGLSSLLSGDAIPDISDLSGLGGGSVVKELALYENILLSRRSVEEAIIKFNIMEEEEFKYMFDALKYFRSNKMTISKDKVAGTMEIGIFDKNPEKAKEIAEFLVQQLNKINTELNVQNARNNREFIQSRYDLARIDLRNVEDSLRIFQDNYGIAPDLQVQAAVKAEIELTSQIKSEEVKLEILRRILSPGQAELVEQEQMITELKKQLSTVQNERIDNDVLTLQGKPLIVLNFYRLKREVEIQNKILSTLIPLLEQSKIEEKRETPSVLVIDSPNVPDKKVKPKRLTLTLIFSFFAGLSSYFYFILKSKWSQFKSLGN
jgi:capsule polysaccharide export protein KpsE/RkpR